MGEKIKSISGAYSLNPIVYIVSSEDEWERCTSPLKKAEMIKEIRYEAVTIILKDNESIIDTFFVGYRFNGEKAFEMRANAVNIEYQL